MGDTSLLFLHSSLLSPATQRELRIPLIFISYAYTYSRMYIGQQLIGTFTLPDERRNNISYGGIYHLQDAFYHLGTLDAFKSCSLSSTKANKITDMNHRLPALCRLISFNTLDELVRLQYQEGEEVMTQTYHANPTHPSIRTRANSYQYRITSGINSTNFKLSYKEESTCNTQQNI